MERITIKELRDQFAMSALTGIIANYTNNGWKTSERAEYAYVVAQAMMEERKKYEE